MVAANGILVAMTVNANFSNGPPLTLDQFTALLKKPAVLVGSVPSVVVLTQQLLLLNRKIAMHPLQQTDTIPRNNRHLKQVALSLPKEEALPLVLSLVPTNL
jgi:hypothetical protein